MPGIYNIVLSPNDEWDYGALFQIWIYVCKKGAIEWLPLTRLRNRNLDSPFGCSCFQINRKLKHQEY